MMNNRAAVQDPYWHAALHWMRDALRTLQGRWYRFRPLPWVVCVGPYGSGKTTLLRALHQAKPSPFTLGDQKPGWYVHGDAWMLDMPGFHPQADREDDSAPKASFWQRLRRVLGKRRLTQVWLVLSVRTLLQYGPEERQTLFQACYETLLPWMDRQSVSLGIVLSKCDQLQGFEPFFGGLSAERAALPWGFTVLQDKDPLASAASHLRVFWQGVQQQVVHRVQQQHDPRLTALVMEFPTQCQALIAPLAELVHVLLPLLRGRTWGCYGVSVQQREAHTDVLHRAFSQAFALPKLPVLWTKAVSGDRALFVPGIRAALSASHQRNLASRWRRLGAAVLGVGLLAYGVLSVWQERLQRDAWEVQWHLLAALSKPPADVEGNTNAALQQLASVASVFDRVDAREPWLTFLPFRDKHLRETLLDTWQQACVALLSVWFKETPHNATEEYQKLVLLDDFSNHVAAFALAHVAQQDDDVRMLGQALSPLRYLSQKPAFLKDASQQTLLRNTFLQRPLADRATAIFEADLWQYLAKQRVWQTLERTQQQPAYQQLGHLGLQLPSFLYRQEAMAFMTRAHWVDAARHALEGDAVSGVEPSALAAQLAGRYVQNFIHAWQQVFLNKPVFPKAVGDRLALWRAWSRGVIAWQFALAEMLAALTTAEASDLPETRLAASGMREGLRDVLVLFHQTALWRQWQTLAASVSRLEAGDHFQAFRALFEDAEGQYWKSLALLPMPVSDWLKEALKQQASFWQADAARRVDQLWRAEWYPECVASFEGRYPFDSSAQDADPHQVLRWFGNAGRLQVFFDRMMAPFVTQESVPFLPRAVQGLQLSWSKEALDRWMRAKALARWLFQPQDPAFRFSFSLTPLSLDPSLQSVRMTSDHFLHHARHDDLGPALLALSFEPKEAVSITYTTLEGKDSTQRYEGPWAWWRMLEAGRMSYDEDDKAYRFFLSDGTNRAEYQVQREDGSPVALWTLFRGWHCPKRLTEP